MRTGANTYTETGFIKTLLGYGSPVPVPAGTFNLGSVAFSYTPPKAGAVLAGLGASQCRWPPSGTAYGVVLCNIQFAFTPPTGAQGCHTDEFSHSHLVEAIVDLFKYPNLNN